MKRQKVVVQQIYGGLGNQLFEYAFGRAFSLRNNAKLLIDPSRLLGWGRPQNLSTRYYALETVFSLSPNIFAAAKIQKYIPSPFLLNRVIYHHQAFPHFMEKVGYWKYIEDVDYLFNPQVFAFDFFNKIYFTGSWQAEMPDGDR